MKNSLIFIIAITIAGGAYDRTQALIDGTIKPEGLDLNWLIRPLQTGAWPTVPFPGRDCLMQC